MPLLQSLRGWFGGSKAAQLDAAIALKADKPLYHYNLGNALPRSAGWRRPPCCSWRGRRRTIQLRQIGPTHR